MPGEISDEYVAFVFSRFGFKHDIFAEFAEVMHSPAAMLDAGVPLHLLEQVKPFMSNSWFTAQGVPHCMI